MMEGSAVTVGTFDGVHRGHQLVLRQLTETARREGLEPLVITFDTHPLAVICPQRAPGLLMDPDTRDSMLRDLGAKVQRVEFTPEVMRKSCAEWIGELVDRYDMRYLVLGYDNTFGCDGRQLEPDDYIRLGRQAGVEVEFAPVLAGCSSSAVRRAVADGDVALAGEMLGHPFTLRGTVVTGRRLGRTIGVPTANLSVSPQMMLPKAGVYKGEATLADGSRHTALVNIGDNPTVCGDGKTRIEAHLPGFSGDIYGQPLALALHRRIRDEKKFDSLDQLRLAIADDIRSLRD